ncbi:OmpA family protein [Acinetobacter pragensis]|uniref:OmpA family protein n=1 Tax=Acinetobacter pragensis TaxID=1806892 RepID=UPI00333F2CAA
MNKNKKMKLFGKVLWTIFPLLICCSAKAQQPVVIEGAVPNEAAKQEILNKAYITYGRENIIDKIQVKMVSAPNGWSGNVSNIITEDLKKVNHGQLTVRGTHVNLTGKITDPNDIQPTAVKLQNLVASGYKVNTQLSADAAEQKIIDAALKNRIIEFESGSAVLAPSGVQILNEMAIALNKVGLKKVKIIGHTDSSGDSAKNIVLSQERAAAVKSYLTSKNIAPETMSTEGLGSNKPVAENTTPDGRKKNRRIEFEVL